MDQQFATEHIDTAQEFVDELRLTNPRWSSGGAWTSDWYFRGQSDSSLTLVPSAWRRAAEASKKTEAEKLVEQRKRDLESHFQAIADTRENGRGILIESTPFRELLLQAFTEFILVRQFIDFADSLGFQMAGASKFPEDPKLFLLDYCDAFLATRASINNYHSQVWENSVVALAQHHGIPTRLLDWTRRPLHAAFFAAEYTISSQNESGQIAVYAINHSSFGKEIGLLTVPRSENANLHAQDGVFTIDRDADLKFLDSTVWRDLETCQELYTPMSPIHPRKLTLPVSEVRELRRLLSLEHISRAYLMPSFDNIVSTLKTRWQWPSEPGL